MMRALLLIVALAGCRQERRHDERLAPRAATRLPVQTSGITAGPARPLPGLANPYAGNVFAVHEGKQLYEWFNCAGCHGAIGGGGMGPPLRDGEWIYGGNALQIHHTILEGRPNGMPAFRGIPPESLWKIIAYVHSLGEHPDEEHGSVAADPEKMRRGGGAEEPHGAE